MKQFQLNPEQLLEWSNSEIIIKGDNGPDTRIMDQSYNFEFKKVFNKNNNDLKANICFVENASGPPIFWDKKWIHV